MNDSYRGGVLAARHWVVGTLAGGFLILGLAGLAGAETWRSTMTGGFADANSNAISFTFAPQLVPAATGWAYVNARNSVSGTQLRRTTDFVTFSTITQNGFGVPANITSTNMTEFDNGTIPALFVGTGRTGAGAGQLYRSTDGVTFTNVAPSGMAGQNKLIVPLAQMATYLYFGTQNITNGAEIWRSTSANSVTSWTQVASAGIDSSSNTTISALKLWNGALYAATINSANGGRIYRSINGTTWTVVADTVTFGTANNVTPGASFVEFGGKLYAGSNNSATGAQLWQTSDGLTWTKVSLPGGDGFGSAANEEFHTALVNLGHLWVGTWNVSVGGQLWRTTDTVNWYQSNSNGWGNPNNKIVMTQTVDLFKGKLYYGSSNPAQGAEIWNVGPPAAVTNLTALAAAGTDGKINLSWTSPDQLGYASQFAVQYATFTLTWSTANAQVVLSTSGVSAGTTMNYQLSGLTMGTTYYSVVWTNNFLGWSDVNTASASAVAPNLAAPLDPTGLAVQAAGQTAVSLIWAANTEADLKDYRVWRSTSAGVTLVSTNTISTPTASSFLDLNLSTNTVYYYRVTARDSANNESPGSTEVSTLTAAGLRIWDGGASTNTASSAANWQYDIPVATGDSVLFDGAVSTKSATWDFTGAVLDLRLENGYPGIVTASGTATIAVQRYFKVYSGTFNASGSTLTVGGDFEQSGAGALNLTSSTVKFDGAGLQAVTVMGGYPFNNFTVASSSKVEAGSILNVDGALLISSGEFTLRQPGDTFNGFHNFKGSATINGGKLDVGTASATFRAGLTVSSGAFIMPPSGGRVELGGNFDVNGGTFQVMGVNNRITSTDPGNVRYAFTIKAASINVTGLTVESVDATGVALDSAVVSTNIVTFDNVRYRLGAPNGAALRYNLSTGPATFVGHDFDNSFSTNVYAPLLSTSTFLIMSGATGSNKGPAFEQDPGNGVFWGVPPIPGGFTAAASGPTSIAWSWTDGADEQGYRVKQATDNFVAFSTGPNYATWAQAGLTANTSQQMYVEAFNPVGIASSAAITKFTNAAAPTGTIIQAISSDTVTVQWGVNGNRGGTVFEVSRATENGFAAPVLGTTTAVSFPFAGLIPNTSYYFRARAQNDDGIFSVYDSTVSTMTATETTAPAAPSGLTLLALDGRANLNWSANTETDLKDYRVYRSTNLGVTAVSTHSVTFIATPGTTHQDLGLTNGTTFYYRVAARDTSLNESGLSNEGSAKPVGDVTPPGVPTITVGDGGNTKASVYWSLVGDADLQDYRVWRSTNAGVTLVSSHTVSTQTARLYVDKGLSNGTTYYYRVTARDFTLNESGGSGEVSRLPAIGEREWSGGGNTNNASEDLNWTNYLSPESGDGMRFNLVSTKSATIDLSPPGGFASMTVIGAYTGTITFSSAAIITGPLTQSGGTINLGDLTHKFSGNVTINGGTFNQTTGTVVLDGAAQTLALRPGAQFWILSATGTAIKTLGSDVTLGNDLNLWAGIGYALDLGTNAVLVAGNVTNNGGSGLTGTAGSRVSLNGGGAGTQVVFAINAPNTDLEINKASGTAFFGATGPTVRNVSLAGGTVDAGGTAVFAVGGNWTQTGGVFNPFGINMTVVLSSPAAGRTVSQVAGSQFGVLKSSGTGSVLATTGITVKNSLDILNGTFEFGAGTSAVSGQARVYGGATLVVSSAVVNFSNTLGDSVAIDSGPTPGTFRMTTANPSPMVGLGRILTSSGTFESQSATAVIRSTASGSFIGINLSSGTVNIGGVTLNGLDNSTGLTVGSSVTIVAFNNLKYRNLQPGAAALRFNKNMNVASAQPQDFDASVTTNVYVTAVSSPNFINMSAATGPKAGEPYEFDPNNRVFWGLPPIPAGLTATALSTDSIRWLWNPGPDEEDYRVIRTSDNFVLTTLLINTTYWDQAGLTPDATQQVFIRAHSPLGNTDSGSFTRATLSSTPTASTITAVTSDTVHVSWGNNGNPGGTLYEAQLSTDVAFSSTAVTLITTVTGTTTGFSGLASKTSYYFQVRSRNLDMVFSSFTAIISTRTSPETQPPVTAITVPVAGGYVINLSTIQGTASDNLSGVTSTYLQIRRNSDNNFWDGSVWAVSATNILAVLSGPPTSRTWTLDASTVTLTNGVAYNIYAYSYDAEGNLETPSPVITVTADTVVPTSSVTTPSAGGRYNALAPSGTSSDAAPGVVSRVEVRIKRISDGFFWNGTGFAAPVAWKVAVGTNPWSYSGVPWADGFQYEVTARAVDSGNNTEVPTPGPTFTFDTIAPAVPATLALLDVPSDQGTGLSLYWTAGTEGDLKDYRVFRSTNNNVVIGSSWTITLAAIAQTGTTHQDTGLTPVTTYYYRVTARDIAGNESPLSVESSLRPLNTLAPAATGFIAVSDAPGDQGFALRINWGLNTETDVREYRLYRSTNTNVTAGSSWTVSLPNLILSPGSTHQDAGLTNGTTFYYRVSARDTSSNESPVSTVEAGAAPVDNVAPSSPTAFVVSDNPGDQGFQLLLAWANNAEPDLQDYRIFESTNTGVTLVSSHVVSAVAGTGFLRGGLTNGTTYYYRLSARDVSLNESPGSSETSASPRDNVSPSSPTAVGVADAPGDQGTTLNLSWAAGPDSDLKDYIFYRSTNTFAGATSTGSVAERTSMRVIAPGTTFQDTGLTPVTTYFYRLTARDASDNESVFSVEVSSRPQDNTAPAIVGAPIVADVPSDQGFALRIFWPFGPETDIREYRIYKSTNAGGVTAVSSNVVTTVLSPGSTHQEGGLTNGTTYYYAVAVRDTSGNQSGLSSEGSGIPYDNLVPSSPTVSMPWVADEPADQGFALRLSWAGNTEADIRDYRLYRSTNGSVTVGSSWTAQVGTILAPGTTHGDTGLSTGATYYYRLTARDVSLNESPTSSESWTFPVDNVSPSSPTAFAVADVGLDQGVALSLSWAANTESDLKDYRVFRSTNNDVTVGSTWTITLAVLTGTTHQDAGLTPVTTYYYRLTARDASGNESPTTTMLNLRPVDNLAPATLGAPTVADAPSDQGFALNINWTPGPETDIREYRLYRSTNSNVTAGSSWTVALPTLILSPGTTYQDTGLSNGTTFYYKVAARDTSGNESTPSAESSSIPYDNTAPGFPGTVTVSPTAAGADAGQRLSLSWSAVGDPDLKDYQVYRSTNSGVAANSSWTVLVVTLPGTTKQDGGLTDGTTFYYRISARDVSLNEGNLSTEVGAAPNDIAPPTPPTGISVAQDVGALRLSWVAVVDNALKDYRVYRSTNTGVTVGSSWTVLTATILQPGTSHVDTALTNETTYYYRVTARDASTNESAGSAEQSGKPSNNADTTPPSAPTGLSLSENIGDTNLLRLTWVASTDTGGSGLLQYRVFRGTYTSPLSSKTVVGTVAQPQTTTADAGLTNNATYYYQVTVRDAALNESAGSTEMSMYPRDLVVPAAITDLTATSQAQILLQWTAPADNFGIVRYEIRYSSFGAINTEGVWSTSVVVGAGVPTPQSPGTTQTAVITGLYPRTTHWFAVKSFDAAGNGSTVNVPAAGGALSGSFVLAQEPAGVNGPAQNGSVAWGDFDGDGDLDIAVSGHDGTAYRFRIYRNDGGVFNLYQEPDGAVGPGEISLAWGDYDREGDLDLLVGGGAAQRIYRNDSGTFVLAQDLGAPGGASGGVAWGDFDNDGDLDFAVNGGSKLLVYRNDGGSFVLYQEPAGVSGPSDGGVAWGDYDNDGDLDLVASGYDGTGYRFRIYRNDSGSFVQAFEPAGPTGPAQYGGVAWGDFDNDGDMDVALSGYDGIARRLQIYRNDGSAFNLAQELAATAGAGNMGSVVWGDFDNDGDLDLMINGTNGAAAWAFQLFRNDGGTFNLAQEPAGSAGPSNGGVAWGDFDNDGDLDVVANGNNGTNMVFRVYKSLEADFGNVNAAPVPPGAGFLTSKSISSGTVTLKWAAGSDAATPTLGLDYIVRVSTISGNYTNSGALKVAWSTATPFMGNYAHGFISSTGPQPGFIYKPGQTQLTYFWQVATVDAGLRSSGWSVEQSTYVDLQPPAIPVGLTVIDAPADQGGAVTVSWTANTEGDLKDYGVYRATYAFSSGAEPAVAFTTVLAPGTSSLQAGLTNGTTYFFRINVADTESNRSSFNVTSASAVPVDNLAPASPTALAAITPFMVSRAVDLSWAVNTEADLKEYKVYRTTSTSGVVLNSSWTVKVTNILASGATHRDAGLGGETSFYYRLTAMDVSGNESLLSPTTTGNPAPATPGLVSVFVPPAGRYLRVSWTANSESDLQDYRIRRSTGLGDGASAPVVATILAPGTSHNDAGLTDGTTYYYTVLARDTELNHSALSTEMSGAPQDTLAPAAPAGFGVADAASGGRLNISWAANAESDLKEYRVFRGTVTNFELQAVPTLAAIIAPLGTTHQDTGLLNGATYYYHMHARDNTGNDSLASAEAFAAPSSSTDATPPTVTILSPVSGKYYASISSATFTTTDTSSVTIVEMSLRVQPGGNWWGAGAFTATTEYWGGVTVASGGMTVSGSWGPWAGSLTPATTYLVGLRAKDVPGNLSAPVYSTFTFTTRSQWLVVAPGEALAEGTAKGTSGVPTSQTAGVGFSANAYLVDSSTYVVYDATDTATVSSSDSFDGEPAPSSMTAGGRAFAFTLVTAGPATTITASGSGYAAHISTPIVVASSSPVKLQLLVPGESPLPGSPSGKVGAPNAQTAGTSFNVTANLVDPYWNLVAGGGMPIVAIQTSDPNDTEPGSTSLVSGSKTFSVILQTAGSSSLTAADVDGIPPLYTAQGATVTVNAGIPTKMLAIVPGETYAPGTPTGKTGSPTNAVQRSSFTVTVRAVDNYSNVVSTTPTVNLTTSDPGDSHPAPQALVGGMANFAVTFMTTPGPWTITAADGAATLTSYVTPGITTVDGLPPSGITDLNTAIAGVEGAVTLTWTAPGDDGTVGTATVYRIRSKTGGAIVNDADWAGATAFAPSTVPAGYGTIQSVTVTGLIPGTTYWFDVRAEDEVPNLATHSNSPGAAAQNFTPAAPVGLTTLDKPVDQGGAISVSWTANTEPDLQHYRIYRSTNSGVVIGSTWTVLIGSVVAPGTTHLDSGLANGATYYYRIAAVDLSNPAYLSPASASDASAIPYDNLVPAIPTGLGAQDASTGSTLNLSWTANPDPDIKDYRIYRTTGLPGVAIAAPYFRTAILSPGTTHRDFGLTDGTTYYYRLTARDASLQESSGSAEVSGVPSILDTTPPTTIADLTALAGGLEGQVFLAWTQASDNVPPLKEYRIRGTKQGPILTQANFNAAEIVIVTTGSPAALGAPTARFDVGGLAGAVTYYWSVVAVDGSNNVAAISNSSSAPARNLVGPTAVAGLTAADARLGGKVRLTWTPNTEPDIVRYLVIRASFHAAGEVVLATVTHPTVEYGDSGLQNGLTYYYHLHTEDLGGLGGVAIGTMSAVVSVMPTGAATLTVSGLPSPYTAGARADLLVAARAGDGSLSASYTGTVRFTSTDGSAVLPGLYTFTSGYTGADAGLHIFKAGVILNTQGEQSVMVADVANPSVAGKQTVTVVALGAIKGVVTRGNTKQPITGVLVAAKSLDTGSEFSATSLTDGTYEIKNLNKGRYKVTASWSEGGVTASVWLESNAGESDRNFTLETKNGLGAVAGSVGSLVSASAKAGTARVVGLSPALAAQALAEDPTLPKVEVRLAGGRTVATVPVNPSGRFEIPNLLTESYEVRAWTGGAWSEPKRVSVVEGQTLSVDFEALGFVPALAAVGPNPAVNGQAPSLWFYADWPSWEAKVSILDASGAPVCEGGTGGGTGFSIEKEAGRAMAPARAFTHRAVWSGSNAEGRAVASGVYLMRLEVTNPETGETRSVLRKAVVIR